MDTLSRFLYEIIILKTGFLCLKVQINLLCGTFTLNKMFLASTQPVNILYSGGSDKNNVQRMKGWQRAHEYSWVFHFLQQVRTSESCERRLWVHLIPKVPPRQEEKGGVLLISILCPLYCWRIGVRNEVLEIAKDFRCLQSMLTLYQLLIFH